MLVNQVATFKLFFLGGGGMPPNLLCKAHMAMSLGDMYTAKSIKKLLPYYLIVGLRPRVYYTLTNLGGAIERSPCPTPPQPF